MTSSQKQLIEIIRSVVCVDPLPEAYTVSDAHSLFVLAQNHDMAHIVGYAIAKNNIDIDTEEAELFRQQYYLAIQRVSVLENEVQKIKFTFEKNGIDFIPLKGTVLRQLYPQKWMRVSADIDILVRSEELHLAEQSLVDGLNYQITSIGKHHNHVTAPSGFHVDLHFTLTEREESAKRLLDDVWNHCHLISGKKHEFALDDDFFYLFHMFHFSVHFRMACCGIRPVLDTWVLNHMLEFEESGRKALIENSDLFQFSKCMEEISERWFSCDEVNEMDEVENYIFENGIRGGHRIAATQAIHGSKTKFILNRLFPPFSSIKYGYPILNRFPILLPFCYLHRLIKAIFTGKTKKAKYELSVSKMEEDKSRAIQAIFNKLGI